jgi:hypothetical protein
MTSGSLSQGSLVKLGLCVTQLSCCCEKTPERHELKEDRFISAHIFSLWSLGSIVSMPMCGEADITSCSGVKLLTSWWREDRKTE